MRLNYEESLLIVFKVKLFIRHMKKHKTAGRTNGQGRTKIFVFLELQCYLKVYTKLEKNEIFT